MHGWRVRHCLARGANADCSRACCWSLPQQDSAQSLPGALQAARLTVIMIKPSQDKVDANPSIHTCMT